MMQYWFRAIETYAPWIRKVHFVTWGHLPKFLNPEYEKIHIVTHRDIIPEDALPTYNSGGIEMNIYKIEDLAEHFIFFNDDIFLTRPCSPDDFFDVKTGFPRVKAIEMPLRFVGIHPWQTVVSNDMGCINSVLKKHDAPFRIGKNISRCYSLKENIRNVISRFAFPEYFLGYKNYHGPIPLLKSTGIRLSHELAGPFHDTIYHRFRQDTDINNWMVHWYQAASGDFSPKKTNNIYFSATSSNAAAIAKIIRERSEESICINDGDDLENWEEIAKTIREAFSEALPAKSGYEL